MAWSIDRSVGARYMVTVAHIVRRGKGTSEKGAALVRYPEDSSPLDASIFGTSQESNGRTRKTGAHVWQIIRTSVVAQGISRSWYPKVC